VALNKITHPGGSYVQFSKIDLRDYISIENNSFGDYVTDECRLSVEERKYLIQLIQRDLDYEQERK
jgi:hypothetical protein